jgi:signal transduction histidine kinase
MSTTPREQAGAQQREGSAGAHLDEQRLRRLIAVGRSVLEAIDGERVLDRVLESAQEITGARYAALGVLDEDRTSLARFLTRGIDGQARSAIGGPPEGRGLLGVLIAEPRPLRLADLRSHPRSSGFPPGHPQMRSFLGVPIMIGHRAHGNLYLTEARKGYFDEADEEAVVLLADWAAIAIEQARLRGVLARRSVELERTLESLRAAGAMSSAMSERSELREILELAVRRTQALLEAPSVAVLVRKGDELVVGAAAGVGVPEPGSSLALANSFAGAILKAGRIEVVDDLHQLPKAQRESLCVRGARSALFAPMRYRGEEVGIICAFDPVPGRPWGEDEERLPEAFVGSTAAAIALARTLQTQRLAATLTAIERERGRWGRELHDQTLQALGAMRLTLRSALAHADLDAWRDTASDLVAQIEREIASLRAIITDLRPPVLDHGGLAAAIRSLAFHHQQRVGLHVRCNLQEPLPALTPELEATLYRIVQESLANVIQHAHAGTAEVMLEERGGSIALEVADDGEGFDLAGADGGFGLAGMRERVELVRGELTVRSGPGGTRVIVKIPIPHPEPASADARRVERRAALGASPR